MSLTCCECENKSVKYAMCGDCEKSELSAALKENQTLRKAMKLMLEVGEFYSDHNSHDWDNNDLYTDMEAVEFFECQTGKKYWCSIKPEGEDHNEPCKGDIAGKLARKNTKQATALLGDALVKEIKG